MLLVIIAICFYVVKNSSKTRSKTNNKQPSNEVIPLNSFSRPNNSAEELNNKDSIGMTLLERYIQQARDISEILNNLSHQDLHAVLVNCTNSGTPLHFALEARNYKAVQHLLSAITTAELSQQDIKKMLTRVNLTAPSPVHLALEAKNEVVFKLLFDLIDGMEDKQEISKIFYPTNEGYMCRLFENPDIGLKFFIDIFKKRDWIFKGFVLDCFNYCIMIKDNSILSELLKGCDINKDFFCEELKDTFSLALICYDQEIINTILQNINNDNLLLNFLNSKNQEKKGLIELVCENGHEILFEIPAKIIASKDFILSVQSYLFINIRKAVSNCKVILERMLEHFKKDRNKLEVFLNEKISLLSIAAKYKKFDIVQSILCAIKFDYDLLKKCILGENVKYFLLRNLATNESIPLFNSIINMLNLEDAKKLLSVSSLYLLPVSDILNNENKTYISSIIPPPVEPEHLQQKEIERELVVYNKEVFAKICEDFPLLPELAEIVAVYCTSNIEQLQLMKKPLNTTELFSLNDDKSHNAFSPS